MRNILYFSAFFWLITGAVPSAGHAADTASAFILPQYSQRISLDFKDADIKDVLKAFSQQIGANFVLSDKVKASLITVFLEKVPVENALEKILKANGLSYQYDADSNIFMVGPVDETRKIITRVYPLKYATVPSSRLLGMAAAGSSSGSSAVAASSGIIVSLQSALTKDARIAEDARTNSLIITDEEVNFPEIEQVLARLDVPVTQIMIEVEMLDVAKSVIDSVGVKFGKEFFQLNGTNVPTFFPFDQNNILDKGGTRTFTAGSMGALNMSMILEFLSTQTDTKNLARPRLLTLDNQTAEIKISTNEAVGLLSSSESTTGLVTETAERIPTGVFLTVTPQVNLLSGEITLAVAPKVIDAVLGSKFGNTTFKDPEERGANVMMKVRAGETIIMGGLLRKIKSKERIKVPVLGDIPVLGRLFRHEEIREKERELLIFITPHIMGPDGNVLNTQGSAVDLSKRETSGSRRSQAIQSELDRAGADRRRR